MRILNISNRIIEYSFYLLLFFVPLFITPLNYEIFEYNKMMITYALTIIILAAWVIKMIAGGQLKIQRTPLDIPLFLFLLSQIISYVFSIDQHVSFWGYYSRFHGGLLSTLSYLILYYALVSNLDRKKVLTGLRFGILGGALVAAYGVAEHFGIDAQYWVQDVKNRVFSTLGQPNWLAAYLSILIPIAIAFGVSGARNASAKRDFPLLYTFYLILSSVFYLALLYTKSRSGFSGFWAGFGVLGILSVWLVTLNGATMRVFLISFFSFVILTFLVGSPFEQINKYFSLSGVIAKVTKTSLQPIVPPPPGGTESGEIRKIVWKGAIDVWRHYPLFGSGVETFAFSYYQYRPVEHNMVSEWDFLYNKAHNEYLNFLATTGIFGLGSYLLLIVWFLGWNFRQISKSKALNSKQFQNSNIKIQNKKSLENLNFGHLDLFRISNLGFGLLAAYITILVSNFFGFSVVIVALFFFLIPAFSFILARDLDLQRNALPAPSKAPPSPKQFSNEIMKQLNPFQWIIITSVLLSTVFCLLFLVRLWQADVYFAKGYNLERIDDYAQAYKNLKTAIEINPREPLYRDEFSNVAAILAVSAAQEKEATQAAVLAREAIESSQKALETSPQNVNFWKTRTRVFYTLAALNEEYNQNALDAIQVAYKLAPTDAKVAYNLAVLYGRVGKQDQAMKTLEETIRLKPDYRDARYALALYLKMADKEEEANRQLKYILEKISPDDEQVKELLGQQKTKR